MKVLIALLISLLLAAPVRAGEAGYVDLTKAANNTQDGKKVAADFQAEVKTRQALVNSADASAKQAADKCVKLSGLARTSCDETAALARHQADAVLQRNQQELQQQKDDSSARITQRLTRIASAIGVAHHLDKVENSTGAVWVAPKLDFTAELVKRYDAGEGKTEDQIAGDLRQKNSELEAKVAKLEKEKADAGKASADGPHVAVAHPSKALGK